MQNGTQLALVTLVRVIYRVGYAFARYFRQSLYTQSLLFFKSRGPLTRLRIEKEHDGGAVAIAP